MGKQWKQCQTLFWGAPKSLQMVIAAMKLSLYLCTGPQPRRTRVIDVCVALSHGVRALSWQGPRVIHLRSSPRSCALGAQKVCGIACNPPRGAPGLRATVLQVPRAQQSRHIVVVIVEVNLVWSPRKHLVRHSINMSATALKFDGRQRARPPGPERALSKKHTPTGDREPLF